MDKRPIAPVVVGRGMAGQAILKSLAIASQNEPEVALLPARTFVRGDRLRALVAEDADSVLFVANPSGLHAEFIAEGVRAGFSAVACNKPV